MSSPEVYFAPFPLWQFPSQTLSLCEALPDLLASYSSDRYVAVDPLYIPQLQTGRWGPQEGPYTIFFAVLGQNTAVLCEERILE